MAKIMLVEDDKNLSAIYKDRLLAEGYDIVTAQDGEEALAIAVKEKPDLIIADVMMPKISGFDMLDILRSTPETKNTRVIMMTALSQAEDQQRAAQLGADKYLVKSQVTLDDVARVVRETLGGEEKPQPVEPQAPTQQTVETPTPTPAPVVEMQPDVQNNPVTEMSSPEASQAPTSTELPAESTAEEKKEIEDEIQKLAENLPTEAPDEVPEIIQPDEPKHGGERVVEPLSNPTDKPDIMALYEKEIANESTPESPTPIENTQEQQPDQPTDPHSISL